MSLKARIAKLETRIGVGREHTDVFLVSVPWPDPDGRLKAAGYQKISSCGFGAVALMEWTRRDGETEAEFIERAKREAPPPLPGAHARMFSADYRGS